MKARNRKTGEVRDFGVLAMLMGILSGKVRVGKAPSVRRMLRGKAKFPRNCPCFCGSKIKFKRCCGATAEQKERWKAAAARHRGDYEWNL